MFGRLRGVRVLGAIAGGLVASLLAIPAPAEAARLPKECMQGRVVCLDKTTQTLRWVLDGAVELSMAARFGDYKNPTHSGDFRIFRKSEHHVSGLYGEPMPFSMFFSGGQAIHFSNGFVERGYEGASRGCVNTRNRAATAKLFKAAQIGDLVHIYGEVPPTPPPTRAWWWD